MKNLITGILLSQVYSLKIAHSLPGRMRIKVPGLKGLDQKYMDYESELVRLAKMLRGLNEITISFITGQALVTYDCTRTTEQELFGQLCHIWNTMIKKHISVPLAADSEKELLSRFALETENGIKRISR